MSRKRPAIGIGTLGELDVDILLVVWQSKKATVKDVFEILYSTRRLAYTTIMTVMGRLAKKGILHQDKSRIPYEYTAVVRRDELAASIVNHVVDRLLDGSPQALIDKLNGEHAVAGCEQHSKNPGA